MNESVIEEIKARTDLAELIASYGVNVRRAGASLKACCPFHNEKTPSFNINESKGFYHCFGCGESGDAIKFVQKMEGVPFMDAVKKLAERCGVKIEEKPDPEAAKRKRLYALMAELAQFYHRCLLKMREAAPAREYLESRALAGETAEQFLIGYAPAGVATILKWAEKYKYSPRELEEAGVVKAPNRPGDQGYHRFGGRLMFTIRDRQGRVVAFSGRQLVEKKNSGKYVNSPETAIFKKSRVLFGFDRAAANIARAPHREAIICEGQIDTIRLHVSGFPVAVASQGTAFTEEHARMLKQVADAVVLCFDDDAAGHKATVRTAGLLLAEEMPVRVVSLPGGEDPDSYLRKFGAEAFRKLLDGAESVMSFQCRAERAKEARPESIDAVKRVTTAVLATVAACPSPVLRASMVGEAAKLLGLPTEALAEELAKTKAAPRKAAADPCCRGLADEEEDEFDGDGEEQQAHDNKIAGEPAAKAAPPPARERALMEFLLANEGDVALAGMVREFLPPGVFAHDFTRGFVGAWIGGADGGADALGAFAETLDPAARGWLDEILAASGKSGASGLAPTDILQEFVRSLWIDALTRERGGLPATGDAAADVRRLEISMLLKRLNMVKWHAVKDIIRSCCTEDETGSGAVRRVAVRSRL